MLLLAENSLDPAQITRLLLSLAVLLGFAKFLGEVARQWGQPAVLGEILAGVLLGPTVLGYAPDLVSLIAPSLDGSFDPYNWLFPAGESNPTRIAEDGFILISATLLLLVVGLDVDLSTVWRQGKATASVSAFGIILPFIIGFGLATALPDLLGMGDGATPLPFRIFCGIAMSITALPVIAKILMDLNLSKSDMGMLVISSAMLNDLVGWIGFAVVLALMGSASGHASGQPSVTMTISMTFVFLGVMLTAGRWASHRVMPWIQAHWSWPGGVIVFVFTVALVCAAFTEFLRIHSIFGAFVAGVAIGDSHHLTERTRDTIHQFVTNIFAPVFFASIGLRLNFIDAFNPFTVAAVFAVAATGKIGGCYFGARLAKMSKNESLAVSFGMAAQGAVGIILGQLAFEAGLIQDQLLVAIVIMALGTSLLSGPAMQRILKTRHKLKLLDILTDHHILVAPKAGDSGAVIEEMAEAAADITGLEATQIADAVLARERIMHTGLPGGLAVPHARLDDLSRPCLVLARSVPGIDFDAPDGQLARVICMILTPTDQPDTQIELLALVAKTFGDRSTFQRTMAVRTATELLALLNRLASQPEDNGEPEDSAALGPD